MMNEEFLHFVWKYRLYDPTQLRTDEGECIEVLRPGDPNPDAGPDFLNCRIRIKDTVWAGNAEIHLRSSDWNRHRHQSDRGYDNVILHLVHLHDAVVKNASGREVLSCVLRCDDRLMQNYQSLRNEQSWASCGGKLNELDPFLVRQWLARMLVERLEKRAASIGTVLEETGADWQEVFYRMVLQAMGMKVNAAPFEILGRSLPYKLLLKHRDELIQIEALLFGQAGLLQKQLFEDDYFTALRKEYSFLQKKYSLKPMDEHLWKFMRMRPGNFPTIRLAQLAGLIKAGMLDFSSLSEKRTDGFLESLQGCAASSYWDTHFRFHSQSRIQQKRIGEEAASLLLINAMIPVLFSWAFWRKDQDKMDYALSLLEQIAPENNAVIRRWSDLGMPVRHAFDTQALLQLRSQYCEPRHCLRCAIGTRIVSGIHSVRETTTSK